MTVSPEQIRRPAYLKNESRFANGLHTVGGIEGGKSIICNIDNILANYDTRREIQEEFKYSKNNSTISMTYYQLEKVHIAQEKAVLKHFALIGWYAENPETVIHDSNDTIWVFDIGAFVAKYSKEQLKDVFYYKPKECVLKLPLDWCIETTRQAWNKHTWDLITKSELDFETLHLEKLRNKFDFDD